MYKHGEEEISTKIIGFLIATNQPIQEGKIENFEALKNNIHLTIVPRIHFHTGNSESLCNNINKRISKIKELEISLGTKDWFGQFNTIPVHHVIDIENKIIEAHKICLELLEESNAVFFDPNMEQGYRPHIAYLSDKQAQKTHQLKYLSLSEHHGGIGNKVIIRKTWKLQEHIL